MGNQVSIVGSGHTKFGRLQENLEQLIVAASQEALQEAGITGNEVDAVFLVYHYIMHIFMLTIVCIILYLRFLSTVFSVADSKTSALPARYV